MVARVSVVIQIMVITGMQEVTLRVIQVVKNKLVLVKKLALHKLLDEVAEEAALEVAEAPGEEAEDLVEDVVSEEEAEDLVEDVVSEGEAEDLEEDVVS